MKEFNIDLAKQGKPVCTRDGRKARIICFDAKRKNGKSIIALVPSKDFSGFEDLIDYPDNGNYYGGHENDGDLMMLPEKHEGWVNIFRIDGKIQTSTHVFDTEEEARGNAIDHRYISTVKIEWVDG